MHPHPLRTAPICPGISSHVRPCNILSPALGVRPLDCCAATRVLDGVDIALGKENHVKALKGTKYSAVYAARRDEWYARKNTALRVLAQTPYARIAFYNPEEPDKRSLVRLVV